MSFADFHVPGAYRFSDGPGSTLSAGIFRPPVSPADSTYNLAKSTGSLYSDISMSNSGPTGASKRKRVSTRESTPVDWNMNMDGANDGREEETRQFRYTLAGQINATPAGPPDSATNGILEDSVYSDVDYRRALGPKKEEESRSVQLEQSAVTAPAPVLTGWSTLALHTIGDVVGKVWEFCKTGSFRGFHAGGGKGYDINTPPKPWCNEHDLPTLPSQEPVQTPSSSGFVQFPQPEFKPFSPDFQQASTPDSTPRPAAKRRQVSGHDELKNWVLVDDREPVEKQPLSFNDALSKARRNTPNRIRQPGYYSQTQASANRRINGPISRVSGGASSLPRGRSSFSSLRISQASPSPVMREPASFAAPRSPVTRGTPSRIPVPVTQPSPNPVSFAGPSVASMSRPSSRQSRPSLPSPLPRSPTKASHRHSQSGASAASTALRRRTGTGIVDIDDIQASPRLDAEAKQLAQKKLAVERDTDARVDAFNARLLNMIRQGKEALGTKIEVMGEGGIEGWEDDL
ncbi:hypothetical protein QBC47DRAFT_300621 [Echria macrotheca]|uniref:Uncharacterized protein n=1 Tax=Echria macrotheca TaxID=438768 RepID=A0AAJ0BF12_9PEZI|nr:hypothetical protein QBC47DRAFT_300621 [Echria macrotheca]